MSYVYTYCPKNNLYYIYNPTANALASYLSDAAPSCNSNIGYKTYCLAIKCISADEYCNNLEDPTKCDSSSACTCPDTTPSEVYCCIGSEAELTGCYIAATGCYGAMSF